MQVLFSLYTLLVLSSSVLTGIAVGKGDRERAERLMAFGMKAALAVGITACVLGYVFFDTLSHLLCKSDDLRPYANAYLQVILVGAIPQMAMYALNQFVAVDGSPQTVSRIAIGGNILNVCLDIVFMKYFGWGIAGAAPSSFPRPFLPRVRATTPMCFFSIPTTASTSSSAQAPTRSASHCC